VVALPEMIQSFSMGRFRRERGSFAMVELIHADSAEWADPVRNIFQQYAGSLSFDLSFQGFAEELANLPGDYKPPLGCLLLAVHGREVVGCAAMRKIGEDVCEMKRLYVVPAWRGKGVGLILAQAVIREAVRIGYDRMRLDTVPSMVSALRLYRSLGFKEIAPYRLNPVPGAKFLELDLNPKKSANDSE
jgi:putative acetyltransferase